MMFEIELMMTIACLVNAGDWSVGTIEGVRSALPDEGDGMRVGVHSEVKRRK